MANYWNSLFSGSGGQNYSPVPQNYTPVPSAIQQMLRAYLQQQNGWQSQLYTQGQNPLYGVPEEYWQDQLSALDAALPWEQLGLARQNAGNSAANQAEANRISWARLAQDAAQSGDAQRLAWAQQGLAQAELALNQELGRGQLGLSQQQFGLDAELGRGNLDLSRQRLGLDERLGMGQLDLSRELGRGNLDLSRQRLGLDERLGIGQLDLQKAAQAQQQMLDEFNKAMQSAQFEYGKQSDVQNRDLSRQLGAWSAFGRKFGPNVGSM